MNNQRINRIEKALNFNQPASKGIPIIELPPDKKAEYLVKGWELPILGRQSQGVSNDL